MARKKTTFEECEFVGKGEEDIRDIIKRQFVRYVNEQKGYAFLSLKNDENHKKYQKNQ